MAQAVVQEVLEAEMDEAVGGEKANGAQSGKAIEVGIILEGW